MMIEMFKWYSETAIEYSNMRDMVREEAGAYIEEWREGHGYSLRKFAFMMDVSPSFLSKIERGKETLSPELAAKFYYLDEMHHCNNCGTSIIPEIGKGAYQYCEKCSPELKI